MEQRQDRLQQRMDGRSDRIDNRGDRIDNRQDRFDQRQQNRTDRRDQIYAHHEHWHHGYWHGGYHGPGARWNYWRENYPVFTAFATTTWAINRVQWAFGYGSYSNPYYSGDSGGSYDYSEPIVMYPEESSLDGDPTATQVEPTVDVDEAMDDFTRAQQEFFAGDYAKALTSTEAALKTMPNDAVVHEFRALVLFALGRYDESAATLYPVLSVGPGWDWTTMSSLYPQTDVYTDQLRKLEESVQAKPDDAGQHFVLAYHYITCDHQDAAKIELQRVLQLKPEDRLAADLLLGIDPEAEIPRQPEITKPPKSTAKVDPKALLGSWTAQRTSGEKFEMTLAEDATFSWTFTAEGKSQTVRGVYAVDDDAVLALEMNDEGTLLAQVELNDTALTFWMLGDVDGNVPLEFVRK